MIILSLSNYELIKYKEDLIREAILLNKLKVTVMILNSSSEFVDRQSYIVGKSLREDIIKSEKRLNELQEELSSEKLIIEKYNYDLPYSLIVTDLNDDYSIAKIDEYIRKRNPDFRPSKAIYKRDNLARYQEFIKPLLDIQKMQN